VGLLAIAGFAAYWSTLSSYFVGDDFETILKVTNLDQSGALDHAGGTLRPVTWLSFAASWAVSGPSPTAFHVAGVAVHVVNAWLVALLARRLLDEFAPRPRPIDRFLPGLCGGIFLVLPTHTEAVSWIAARGDLLMTTACLAALINWTRPADGSWRRWLTTALFAIAMLTKESAITFPFVLVAFDVFRSRNEGGRRAMFAAIRRPWPEFLVVAGFLALRRALRGNFLGGQDEALRSIDPLRLVAKAAVAVARSLIPGMGGAGWLIGGVVLATVALGAGIKGARDDGPGRGMWWFLGSAVAICVAPIANLGVQATGVGGERLIYLPSAFSVVAAVFMVRPLLVHSKRVTTAALGFVVGLAFISSVVVNGWWVDAGVASRGLIEPSAEWAVDQRVVMLNSPDSIGGAVVARNSLAAASMLLHGWSEPALISEVSSVRLAGPLDRVEVTPGNCDSCVRLRLVEPGSSFAEMGTPGSAWEVPDIDVEQIDERTIEVRLHNIPLASVWYFHRGRATRLPPR